MAYHNACSTSLTESNEEFFEILWKDKVIQEISEEVNQSNDIKVLTADKDQSKMEQDILDNNSASLSSDLSWEEYQKHIFQLTEENTHLKDRILQNNEILKAQNEKIFALQEYEAQMKEKKDSIEMLKKENSKLTNQIEELMYEKEAQDDNMMCLKKTLSELRESHEKNLQYLKSSKMEINQLKEENCNLNNELFHEKIGRGGEITALHNALSEAVDCNDMNKKKLNFAEKELEKAKTDLTEMENANKEKQKTLKKEIENLRTQLLDRLEEEGKIVTQLRTANIALRQLEHNKVIADGQIDCLKNEVFNLRTNLQNSQGQAEELFALKAQLRLFEADFEAEVNTKRDIMDENKKLSEEVQTLRMCCQHLQEEVNAERDTTSSSPSSVLLLCPLCSGRFMTQQALAVHAANCTSNEEISAMPQTMPSPLSTTHSLSMVVTSTEELEEQRRCPICKFAFKGRQAFEHHVSRCLDVANSDI